LADDARGDGGDLLLVGIEGDEGEPEPSHGIAHHRARPPAVARHHSAEKINEEGEEDGNIAEGGRIEACDHAGLVADEEHGTEGEDEQSEPSRHAVSLSDLVKLSRRAGNAAMMADRSASLIDAQLAISSMVRPQPTQSPSSASSKQTFTQGVSTVLRPVDD